MKVFSLILSKWYIILQRNCSHNNLFSVSPTLPHHPVAPSPTTKGNLHILHVLFPIQRFLRSCWKCCSLSWTLYFILKKTIFRLKLRSSSLKSWNSYTLLPITHHLPEHLLFTNFTIVTQNVHSFWCLHCEKYVMDIIQSSSELKRIVKHWMKQFRNFA